MNLSLTHFAAHLSAAACLLIGSGTCLADTQREGEWLHFLQQGQTEGMAMPHTFTQRDDVISLSQSDLKRLIGARQVAEEKRSKLQFSKLNYQADVSDKSLQLRLFYQF